MTHKCNKKFHKRVEDCLSVASKNYGSIIDIPQKGDILFNFEYMDYPILAHATMDTRAKHAKFIISLSAEYAKDYWEEFEELTIPHELAHVICFNNGVNDDHGDMWGELCTTMGGTSDSHVNIIPHHYPEIKG